MEATTVTKIFLLALLSKKLVQSYLDHRNKRHIIENRPQVPLKFRAQISLEDHQKAADYSVAKINCASVFNFIDLLILLTWTLGGGLNALNIFVLNYNLGPIWSGVAFFLGLSLISSLLSLPQSIYTTFVLEERFGFNRTNVKTFIVDMLKGGFIALIITIPLLYVLLSIMQRLGDQWWIWAWAFLTAIQLIMLWAYPVFIAPLFNKFSALAEGETKVRILALLERTGFTSNGLFVMDASKRSSHGNAYFTGLGKNKRIVFFDNLIKTLTAPEIEAVLAHELGHFKKKHVMKQLIKGMAMSFAGLFILGQLLKSPSFFAGHGVSSMETYMALILFMMVAGIYTFWLTPLSSYTSRKHEFEADEFAANHSQATDLISALVKLYKDNASTLTPDPWYSQFYHSHPPALIRVQFLEGLEKKA